MRGTQLVALVALLSGASADDGKAEAAAVPVVQSLLTWVEKSKATSHTLQDHFADWCTKTQSSQAKLHDETTRRVQDAERKLAQMTQDQKRVQSTRQLIQTATNATAPEGLALTALTDLQDQVKGETDLLVRAQETAGHALHLATLSSDPDAGATDGLESSADSVVALLSEILHEADVQRAAVAQEQTRLSALFANFTHSDTAAATQLGDEAQEIDSEARARVRTTARLASELADLKRVVAAAAVAQNRTGDICNQQAAESTTAEKQDRQDSADEWAVRSALDQLAPPPPAAFLQVRAVSTARMTRAARFAAGLMQMAHHAENPDLERAAQVLDKKDAEQATKHAAPARQNQPLGASDPLAEIAAWSADDTVADTTTPAAKEAYDGLRESLDRKLKQLLDEEARCREAETSADQGQTLVAKTAQKNAALLRVASSLTEEREQDVHFLDAQVAQLDGARNALHDLNKEEKQAFDALEKYAKDAPVNLYSVATDLTAAGNPKMGTSLESLVNLVQKRTQAAEKQHTAFAAWSKDLEQSLADLERALSIDEAHTTRRARDSEAERTYRASMAASAEQGSDAAKAVRVDAQACEGNAQALTAQRKSVAEQLQQLDSLWGRVQQDGDA